MKIKPSPINIPSENPFKEDALNRRESVEILTHFISIVRGEFVLAIDSPWGTGKTTFLRMWMQHLKNAGYHCLYFNAWESDFSDDPFISLIAEIELGIKSLDDVQKKKPKRFLRKPKRLDMY